MCECEDRIDAAPGKPRPGERRPAGREGTRPDRPPTPVPLRPGEEIPTRDLGRGWLTGLCFLIRTADTLVVHARVVGFR